MSVDSDRMGDREQKLHQVLGADFEAAETGVAPDRAHCWRIIPTSPPISPSSSRPNVNSMR